MNFCVTAKELKNQLVSQTFASVSLKYKLTADQRTILKSISPKISFQEYMAMPKTLAIVGITLPTL